MLHEYHINVNKNPNILLYGVCGAWFGLTHDSPSGLNEVDGFEDLSGYRLQGVMVF